MINTCSLFVSYFILYGTVCASCSWVAILFPPLEKFIYCNLFKYFLRFFLFFFFFQKKKRDPYNSNADEFDVAQEIWDCPHIFIRLLFLYSILWQIPTILSFTDLSKRSSTLILSFVSVILPLIPYKVFFISVVHFSSACLLLSYFRYLLIFSLSSWSVTPFLFQDLGSLYYHYSIFQWIV